MVEGINTLFGRKGLAFQIDCGYWRKRKIEFWERMWEDLEIGYLDEDLLPVLIVFNLDKNVHTLSSCSGRIIISDSTYPWSREEGSIVFKKHYPIRVDEIIDLYDKRVVRRLWINVTGPIIHLSTTSIEMAEKILQLAREAGLKHSGVLSFSSDKGIILELTSGVKMSHILRTPTCDVTPRELLPSLVEVANTVLIQGKRVLARLFNVLHESFPFNIDEYIEEDLKSRGIKVAELSFPYSL